MSVHSKMTKFETYALMAQQAREKAEGRGGVREQTEQEIAVELVFPGAEVAVDTRFLTREWTGEGAQSAAKLRAAVYACKKCGLRDGCKNPTAWEGGTGVDYAIVDGRAGMGGRKAMKTLLEWAGLDGWNAGWVSAVSCAGEDTPRVIEQARCRERLFDQLAAMDARRVLLVGGAAMDAWRPDLAVSGWHGEVGVWGENLLVMGIRHPGGLKHVHGGVEETIRELELWRKFLEGSENPLAWMGRRCGGAGKGQWCESVKYVDPDGIGWCAVHEMLGRRMWNDVREKWLGWEQAQDVGQNELPWG